MAEKKYPLDYKEYEEKVVELFLNEYSGNELEIMTERIEAELGRNPNIIESFYGDDCFTYDNPKLFGDNCKKIFEDSFLESRTVRQLRMILEGN